MNLAEACVVVFHVLTNLSGKPQNPNTNPKYRFLAMTVILWFLLCSYTCLFQHKGNSIIQILI